MWDNPEEITKRNKRVTFTGLLLCSLCNQEDIGVDKVSAGWSCIEINNAKRFYICRDCRPPKESDVQIRNMFYQTMINGIAAKLKIQICLIAICIEWSDKEGIKQIERREVTL